MRKLIVSAAFVAFCIAFGLWWDPGHGQSWLAVHTGIDYCNVPPRILAACKYYNYHSGFGSYFPWVFLSMGGIITGLVLAFRHTNCHSRGCWRIGKYQLAGGEYKVCGKHNLGFEGKHPTLEHIWARHLQHKGKEAGNGGK